MKAKTTEDQQSRKTSEIQARAGVRARVRVGVATTRESSATDGTNVDCARGTLPVTGRDLQFLRAYLHVAMRPLNHRGRAHGMAGNGYGKPTTVAREEAFELITIKENTRAARNNNINLTLWLESGPVWPTAICLSQIEGDPPISSTASLSPLTAA